MNQKHPLTVAISNCDREPIHIPGSIQPFGTLIATDLSLETVTHVSENISDFLSIQPSAILGHSLSEHLPSTFLHDLRNAASGSEQSNQRRRLGSRRLEEHRLEASLHQSNNHLILELESIKDPPPSTGVVTRVQSMLGYLQSELSSEALLHKTVSVLRHVTHFDRVMAYQFLADGSGEVIAEARSSLYEPYLGLRYPATDIPKPVRDIALKMPVRAIANIQAQSVALLHHDNHPPLDLSLTYLRSVSPIHVEYLTNMGVCASMNIAIVVQGKLWGLLACHHYSPKLLSLDLRASCELFSHMLSLNLQQVLATERLQHRKYIASTAHKLFTTPREDFQFLEAADWFKEVLCPIMAADGLAVVAQQQVKTSGDTPNTEFILDLVHQCCAQSTEDILPIEQLRQVPQAVNTVLHPSAGALIVRLSEIEQLYLIFWRNEVATKIRWGGNPEKELVYGTFGPRLRPRASFEEYIETVTGHGAPWSNRDIDAALELRSGLLYLAISHLEVIQQEALRQKRQQDLLIAELNHRVKNILALIRSITHQTKESAGTVEDYAATLEKRIAALASAHDLVAGHGLEWPQLKELIKIELRPYLAESAQRVQLFGPAVGLKADFVPTFVLVLHELVSNAAKYGSLSQPTGQVEVRWSQGNGGLAIRWQERNGPPVFPPQRTGFGRKLIERSIAYEFDGQTDLKFAPQGVEAQFWIPNELVLWQVPSLDITPKPNQPQEQPQDLRAGRVLVVEDNLLIAMELEGLLQSLGFEHIDTAPRVSSALQLLQQQSYTLGLLDINLKGETSFAIAAELLQQNIPFLFTTGYDSKYTVPDHLAQIKRLKKPLNAAQLEQAIDHLSKCSIAENN